MNGLHRAMVGCACLVSAALSQGQAVYARPHDVLVQAIRKGHAEGQLTGSVADLFTKQFYSNGPLMVRADVIAALEQEGCKRVQVVYTKKDVTGPKGVSDVVMDTKINYCLDGRAPGRQP